MIVPFTSLDEIDRSFIERIGIAFADESGIGNFDYDHFYAQTEPVLKLGIGRIFLMLKDGEPTGLLGGMIHSLFFAKTRVALEMFWYVDKEHRGSMESIRILKAYEQWAEAEGVSAIMMAFMEKIHSEKMREFYERRGYTKLESGYIRYL